MQDPPSQNIAGKKVVTSSVEHNVDWGYVALGLGLLAVAYVGYRLFSSGESAEERTATVS